MAADNRLSGAMEKSIFDIQLMNCPTTRKPERENCSWLDDWTKSFIVINARALSKASEEPASLIPFERAICLELVLENPLVRDNVTTCG